MNHASPRFDNNAESCAAAHSALTTILHQPSCSPAARRALAGPAARHNLRLPALLRLQQTIDQAASAILVCDSPRSLQSHAYEFLRSAQRPPHHSILTIHEMLPTHQRNFILESLHAQRDHIIQAPLTLFTTAAYYPELCRQLPHITRNVVTLTTTPLNPIKPAAATVPSINCICLRTNASGRWILTDHKEATTVSPATVPTPEIVTRLLDHTVTIHGTRLAPYLAMMFDLPHAWKQEAALAPHALLIFENDRCPTGCRTIGIPQEITWDHTLGIIH